VECEIVFSPSKKGTNEMMQDEKAESIYLAPHDGYNSNQAHKVWRLYLENGAWFCDSTTIKHETNRMNHHTFV
jgi:hypothetical protein